MMEIMFYKCEKHFPLFFLILHIDLQSILRLCYIHAVVLIGKLIDLENLTSAFVITTISFLTEMFYYLKYRFEKSISVCYNNDPTFNKNN